MGTFTPLFSAFEDLHFLKSFISCVYVNDNILLATAIILFTSNILTPCCESSFGNEAMTYRRLRLQGRGGAVVSGVLSPGCRPSTGAGTALVGGIHHCS